VRAMASCFSGDCGTAADSSLCFRVIGFVVQETCVVWSHSGHRALADGEGEAASGAEPAILTGMCERSAYG